ncbi:pyroglutamyl-peptidase 1 [Helicoverpa armigera]|uniref:pyroglutamyl-peptidase 1 n=1 Tax=Helicoverpa armigera TaxID=29058 RepID=UPI003082AE2D
MFGKTIFTNTYEISQKKVLVTGFGPFHPYKENASWEGVRKMNESRLGADITLCTSEIAVRYKEVDRLIPELYRKFQPHFAMHVGVADTPPECFYLESKANKPGTVEYLDDEAKERPVPDVSYQRLRDYMTTSLDVHSICKEFNHMFCGTELEAVPSNDAGRYLCEYIYYKSLCLGPALFVHVPSTKYSYDEIANGLESILKLCVKQLYTRNDYSYFNLY